MRNYLIDAEGNVVLCCAVPKEAAEAVSVLAEKRNKTTAAFAGELVIDGLEHRRLCRQGPRGKRR